MLKFYLEIKNHSNKMPIKKFPKNILVLATHGSAEIPSGVKKNLHPAFSKRLQKNFSDFGTKYLIKNFPKSQTASPKFGRIMGDTNRGHFDADLFREVDFNQNQIWQKELSTKQKNKYETLSRKAYLDSVFAKIETMCQKIDKNEPIILMDLHDTGNKLLGKNTNEDHLRSEFIMPTAIFSNQKDQTSNHKFLQNVSHKFSDAFKTDNSKIKLNTFFYGGFITQFFGGVKTNPRLEKIFKKYNRSHNSLLVVQCELNRALYLDEKNQKIRPEIGRIRTNFEKFIQAIA